MQTAIPIPPRATTSVIPICRYQLGAGSLGNGHEGLRPRERGVRHGPHDRQQYLGIGRKRPPVVLPQRRVSLRPRRVPGTEQQLSAFDGQTQGHPEAHGSARCGRQRVVRRCARQLRGARQHHRRSAARASAHAAGLEQPAVQGTERADHLPLSAPNRGGCHERSRLEQPVLDAERRHSQLAARTRVRKCQRQLRCDRLAEGGLRPRRRLLRR